MNGAVGRCDCERQVTFTLASAFLPIGMAGLVSFIDASDTQAPQISGAERHLNVGRAELIAGLNAAAKVRSAQARLNQNDEERLRELCVIEECRRSLAQSIATASAEGLQSIVVSGAWSGGRSDGR